MPEQREPERAVVGTNIAHLRASANPIERAAYWLTHFAWYGLDDHFDELQRLSAMLQGLAVRLSDAEARTAHNAEAREIVAALAARPLTHCTQNGCYCQVCGGSWYPNEEPDHAGACAYARAVAWLAQGAPAQEGGQGG